QGREAERLRGRRRGSDLRLGRREDRRQDRRGLERQGGQTRGRALRMVGQPRLQPLQQGGASRLALPQRRLGQEAVAPIPGFQKPSILPPGGRGRRFSFWEAEHSNNPRNKALLRGSSPPA